MARAALGWSTEEAARHAGISFTAISRFEMGRVKPNAATLKVLRLTYEAAGVAFMPDGSVRPPPLPLAA